MSSELDNDSDLVSVVIDQTETVIAVTFPGGGSVELPMSWFRYKAKVGNDGVAVLSLTLRADQLVVLAPPAVEVTMDVPPPVSPADAFEAQMQAARAAAMSQQVNRG